MFAKLLQKLWKIPKPNKLILHKAFLFTLYKAADNKSADSPAS